jgi:hypothetical protein
MQDHTIAQTRDNLSGRRYVNQYGITRDQPLERGSVSRFDFLLDVR